MIALVALSSTVIVQLVVLLVVLGIVWYFIAPYIGEPFRTIIVVLVVLLFCLWLLKTFGIV